ncbi:MAG: hypothetical protein MUC49_15940 [Raineya sp.]|jgi:hypothetical protein|nr:hypothetical protein [Raineya sp.]
MLDYFKLILEKVSFDKFLFQKELRKALASLKPSEKEDFRKWCYHKFEPQYKSVLNNEFKMILS